MAILGGSALMGCGRTIHWNVTGPESEWATIEVRQKEPIFQLVSIDGAEEYPTRDSHHAPLGSDFQHLRIKVMPGEHTLVLICRYETSFRSRDTSRGRLVSRTHSKRFITRTVSVPTGALTQIRYENSCPAEPPCEAADCPD